MSQIFKSEYMNRELLSKQKKKNTKTKWSQHQLQLRYLQPKYQKSRVQTNRFCIILKPLKLWKNLFMYLSKYKYIFS